MLKNQGNRIIINILGIKVKLKRKHQTLVTKVNYLEKYLLAKSWIEKYTVDNKGYIALPNDNYIYNNSNEYNDEVEQIFPKNLE